MAEPTERSARARRRLERELATVLAMLRIHCRGVHGGEVRVADGLCRECAPLWGYVKERAGRCPFLEDKPTCLACTVHCYRGDLRERIRAVMRYAGPRMWWRHPVLTLFHFLEGRRGKGSPP